MNAVIALMVCAVERGVEKNDDQVDKGQAEGTRAEHATLVALGCYCCCCLFFFKKKDVYMTHMSGLCSSPQDPRSNSMSNRTDQNQEEEEQEEEEPPPVAAGSESNPTNSQIAREGRFDFAYM